MGKVRQYANNKIDPVDFILSSGESVSAFANVLAIPVWQLLVPAGVEGTEIYFEASTDSQEFFSICNLNGSFFKLNISGIKESFKLTGELFKGLSFIRIRSNQVQTADRLFKFIVSSV